MKPASRLDTIPEYIFATLNRAVAEVEKTTGRKVLDFGAGSPEIQPAKRYRDKLAELAQEPQSHHYPGYRATPEFAQALLDWYQRRFGVNLETNELLPLNGAKDGLTHLPLALFNPEDEVLVPDPGYPPFSTPAKLVGAVVITYDLLPGHNFKINFESIAKKISKRTKFIWVNFPSNPTGQVATLTELRAIVAFAKQHQLFILYDNAYSEITFDGFVAPSILQVEGAKDCAVEIGSFAKSHSFAGYRMGWIVGNTTAISALAKLKSQMDSGQSLLLQGLGAYALENPDAAWQEHTITSYKTRRDTIAEHLKLLGLTFDLPAGSLYIWAKIPDSAKDSETFCMKLLDKKQILLTPGTAYGQNGQRYVRASICVNIDKIGDYFS